MAEQEIIEGNSLTIGSALDDATTAWGNQLASENGEESLEEEIAGALGTLKDREKEVVEMYFGIGKVDGYCMDLDEIAEEVGLSRERTRQIKEKAVRRLRHRARSRKLVPYVGHNKLKRVMREYNEEEQRKDEYRRNNSLGWRAMHKLEKTKPWNNEQ